MPMSLPRAFFKNFLGQAPDWYKLAIISFLIINPLVFALDPFAAGWLLVVEFIFTLAMALQCYPLQPGGLLAIEAVAIGMTDAEHVLAEVSHNLEVLLLLIFMVAGIYFMKDLLMYLFTKLIVRVTSKVKLSIAFCAAAAVLSAFLDALTVIAVVISVAVGFYAIYHKVASGKSFHHAHDHTEDSHLAKPSHADLEQFRGFLRNLMMHAAVGTALGGVMTLVGEPQNLIIADAAGWGFIEFFMRVAPVSVPTFLAGITTCIFVEKRNLFGYGYALPQAVHQILQDYDADQEARMTNQDRAVLIAQVAIALWLVIGLALHLAAVGMIGLSVIILASSAKGVVEEHALGKAFEEALPFTALLTVFFAVVAVINDQNLFAPVIDWALSFEGNTQLLVFYLANGLLSMISDNVFVGTVYINELSSAMQGGAISREQFDLLAVAVNTGTNLPSVATPNGQAAFLFLLTSAIAPLLRLSYGRMVWMALPYTLVLTIVGLIGCFLLLEPMTLVMESLGWLPHHSLSELATSAAAHTGH